MMESSVEEEVPMKIMRTYSKQDKSSCSGSPNTSSYSDNNRSPFNGAATESFFDRSPNRQPPVKRTFEGSVFCRPSNRQPPCSPKFTMPSVRIGAASPAKSISPDPLIVESLAENERIFNAKIINYPEGAHIKDQLSISSSDLDCLNQCKMLNDNIVYLYLKYLTLEKIGGAIRNKLHLFNTFFYSKLQQLKTSTDDIRRWIKDVDIFDKDFLVIPVCDQIHWFLIIICYPGEVPGHEDPITIHDDPESWNPETDNPRVPAIIILDSLGLKNRRSCTKYVREFLQYESDKRNKSSREFSRESIKEIYAKVPTQTNSYDCGIYILQYFEEFFKNPTKNYIKMYQCKNMTDWFERITIIVKRQKIRELINEKQSKQANKKIKAIVNII